MQYPKLDLIVLKVTSVQSFTKSWPDLKLVEKLRIIDDHVLEWKLFFL